MHSLGYGPGCRLVNMVLILDVRFILMHLILVTKKAHGKIGLVPFLRLWKSRMMKIGFALAGELGPKLGFNKHR